MKSENQKLIIEQLDRKFELLNKVSIYMSIPSNGWINTIRKTLKISLRQLSKKLGVSSQNVQQLELREKDGTISIQKLNEIADALNCKFVYALIPQKGSLQGLIEERALKIAEEIVLRTSHSMKLEEQENSKERILNAIKDKSEKIIKEMPKYLWD